MNNKTVLSTEEIIKFTNEVADWKFEDDRLKADFALTDFDAAIRVVNGVAAVAREMDHHPLMTNVYNRVIFSLCTHRVGDKVTGLDLTLARRISEVVAKCV